jgi:hypothetical protein
VGFLGDFKIDDQVHGLVMEFCRYDLDKLIQLERHLTFDEVSKLMKQLYSKQGCKM